MLDIIRGRYSVRNFKSQDIPNEMVETILDAARWAPSAGNLQPWYFYVVRTKEHRDALAFFALKQSFISKAPVCFLVCVEPARSARVYGSKGEYLYSIQDTAAAVQNILLAAKALGLGGCWVGAFDEEKVWKHFQMPSQRKPIAIIPVGYPDISAGKRSGRRDIGEISQLI